MTETRLLELLAAVKTGALAPADALATLRALPFAEVEDFARIDHHRTIRTGIPEVIFCQGKRPEEVAKIAAELTRHGSSVLATRADAACVGAVRAAVPHARFEERARCIVIDAEKPEPGEAGVSPAKGRGEVLVVSAGTSDIPVAEEVRVTAECFGSRVRTLFDCGVSGLHRLLAQRDALSSARVIVVVAGMEGALPSVIGGLAACPVIAVPTSIGYGASFGGLAALLAMLNSCAAGVAVVNIDNGFGAGTIAHRINAATCDAEARRA
jgi:NCAIR mutase (PurE)-related protein